MTASRLRVGAVFLAAFPEHDPNGHEQEGKRPAIVVGLPTNAGPPRYPVLLLAPVTTYRSQPWVTAAPALYPVLPSGAGNLTADSVVLTDQTRALDQHRGPAQAQKEARAQTSSGRPLCFHAASSRRLERAGQQAREGQSGAPEGEKGSRPPPGSFPCL